MDEGTCEICGRYRRVVAFPLLSESGVGRLRICRRPSCAVRLVDRVLEERNAR